MSTDRSRPSFELATAAEVVGLAPAVLEALALAGYVSGRRAGDGTGSVRFELADLKAFVARNADNGSGVSILHRAFVSGPRDVSVDDLKPEDLAVLLDERAGAMATRVLKMFSEVYPEAGRWTEERQGRFVQATKERFESILAVASAGSPIDEDLYRELRGIGAEAARSHAELTRLLVVLRLTRDLVVQNAVDLAQGTGRHGTFALSLLLTRILPTMDQLSDALATGYWEAMFPS